MSEHARWICCHLGAREHYAVPRALHRRGDLLALITDAWASPGSVWPLFPGATGRRLRERYSTDLASAEVRDFTASLVAHEAWWRVQGLRGWPLVVARNRWFQARAAAVLTSMPAPAAVFAHSYAALEIFRAAKARGSSTVLGQIDPGLAHVDVVRRVADRWPEFGPRPAEPPAEYFAGWREECRLADRIIVNSEWSRDSLQRAGIEVEKIRVVPLPYQADEAATIERRYPAAFTPARPLRVLFVGSVAAFKGVPSLLESLDQLDDAAIELRLVGPLAATIPQKFLGDRRVSIIGAVSRSDVMDQYRDADVLVFPSHSDGFGMAQVEAQAWRLPIIASRACGRVVQDGVDGLLLPEVSADAIAAALRQVMQPGVLMQLSQPAAGRGASLDAFGDALSEMRPRG
jgi:glycosyltransferase involved in cell wall biosynthesis